LIRQAARTLSIKLQIVYNKDFTLHILFEGKNTDQVFKERGRLLIPGKMNVETKKKFET